MDYFEHSRRMESIREAETENLVADSMAVRLALVARIKSGEMTLEEGQAELKRIQRAAKKNGQVTRGQVYRNGGAA